MRPQRTRRRIAATGRNASDTRERIHQGGPLGHAFPHDPLSFIQLSGEQQAFTERRVLVGASLSLSKAFTVYSAHAGALAFPWSMDPALSTSCRGTYSNCARAPMSVLKRMAADADGRAALLAEHTHRSAVLIERADARQGQCKRSQYTRKVSES